MDSHDKQTTKNRHFGQAMQHALSGVWNVFSRERNMRYHGTAAVIAVAAGFWLKISEQEWLWIIFAIFFVFLSEFANTVAESLTDLIVKGQYHPLAKRVKDVSAGSVLISALFAIIVGAIIFVPKLFRL
ncbi:Diacylglycerol kinase [Paucilactobacillus wasatchensis]|uniref:Diacylglycerol kinase n=2 Tax=Paucilactobacillus wasatchensis TaxID=1335616 RepID=A0A0D1A6G9_9LACO|nr:diacylglycerol kinase family protein [Paucilactobacillus wasatchensis]KIS03475.1 Diacylglycerol kinase [Paucilactobacillus wasatchensis]